VQPIERGAVQLVYIPATRTAAECFLAGQPSVAGGRYFILPMLDMDRCFCRTQQARCTLG
jgi:hypothetical protein